MLIVVCFFTLSSVDSSARGRIVAASEEAAIPGPTCVDRGARLPLGLLWPTSDDLPLIVTKAEEEARSRLALKQTSGHFLSPTVDTNETAETSSTIHQTIVAPESAGNRAKQRAAMQRLLVEMRLK